MGLIFLYFIVVLLLLSALDEQYEKNNWILIRLFAEKWIVIFINVLRKIEKEEEAARIIDECLNVLMFASAHANRNEESTSLCTGLKQFE